MIERTHSTNSDALHGFIKRNVDTDSIVHTDSFRAYNGLNDAGYEHLTVNHFVTFKNRKTGACTNLIESAWAVIKRHLCRFCGGWRNNLDLWLAEMEARIEHRDNFHKYLRKALRAQKICKKKKILKQKKSTKEN